jgi:hypothetical protein
MITLLNYFPKVYPREVDDVKQMVNTSMYAKYPTD